MYLQEPDVAVVYRDIDSMAKTQGNVADGQREALSMRLTKADSGRTRPLQVEEAGEIYKRFDSRGWNGSWTWRGWSYNRVPPALEVEVHEKFKQGWSKSKLAREFRLNRRTVIRICRDRQTERATEGQ